MQQMRATRRKLPNKALQNIVIIELVRVMIMNLHLDTTNDLFLIPLPWYHPTGVCFIYVEEIY